MEKGKKVKVAIGIIAGIAVGVGLYFGVKALMKPKEEEKPEEEAKPEGEKPAQKLGSGISVKKAAPKPSGFGNGNQPAPKTNITVANPKIKGQKTWVYAKYDNTKVYQKSTDKRIGLGALYNSYAKGKIIGTYAGSTSVGGEKFLFVNDAGKALIVSEKLTYTRTL